MTTNENCYGPPGLGPFRNPTIPTTPPYIILTDGAVYEIDTIEKRDIAREAMASLGVWHTPVLVSIMGASSGETFFFDVTYDPNDPEATMGTYWEVCERRNGVDKWVDQFPCEKEAKVFVGSRLDLHLGSVFVIRQLYRAV